MSTNKTYEKIKRGPLKYIPFMILISFAINLLSLALPLTMKQIYGHIIMDKSLGTLMILLAGCTIALMLEVLLRRIKDSSSKWIAAQYENRLSTFLIRKMLNTFESEQGDQGMHNNAGILNAVSRIASYYSTSFYQLFIDLPFMCLFLYLIYFLGRELVFVPLVLSAVYVVIMVVNTMLYAKNRKMQLEADDRLMGHLVESLEKIHLIKAAGLEAFQITKFKKILQELTETDFRTNRYEMLPGIMNAYFSQLTLFSILIGGSYMMMNGGINFGEITACALLGGRAIGPVQSMMSLLLQYKDIRILKEKIETIAMEPDQYDKEVPLFPEDILGTIEIMNLEYEDIQNNAMRTFSCQITSGSLVIISPTEFLSYRRVINKLIGWKKITGGRILVDNLNITEWNMDSLKGKIAYLSDRVSIFKGSILDNITYFNAAQNADAYEAASITGFDALVTQMSDGFETPLDSQSINSLSSAFLQRLNLTRALLVRPRILILDRLDESMDYETFEIYLWLINKFKGRLTMIVATDRPEIKALADGLLKEVG